MTLFNYLTAYLLSVAIFAGIDLLWLGVVARDLYRSKLGTLMAERPVWGAAAAFYALFLMGLVYFAVVPGVKAQSWQVALLNGALYGFFTYMTYELTNWAVIKDWPASLVPIDIAWGVVVAATVAAAVTAVMLRFPSF